jgi:hypothetical protein
MARVECINVTTSPITITTNPLIACHLNASEQVDKRDEPLNIGNAALFTESLDP